MLGEGLIIGGDGLGYYAWLRSPLIDGDWSFDNEFDDYNVFRGGLPARENRTALGLRNNHYPIGLACIWAPAVVSTHVLLNHMWPGTAPWPADGYTLPYQLAVGLTSLVVSLMGLGFLYAISRRYAGPGRAALTAGFLTLGTTIVYYSTIEVSMAHGVGMTALAALIWYWLRTYGSLSPRRWLVVGALVGLVTLIRSQLGTFAVLPAAEALVLGWRALRAGRAETAARALAALCQACVAAFVVFSPQLVGWRCVFGHWWALPHHLAHHWSKPAWWQLLCSKDRSLFYWTPITLLACIGTLVYCFKRPRCLPQDASASDPPLPYQREPIVLLAIAFFVQAYFVASVWGSGVFLGSAFGFRLLTEALVALAPGLALLLSQTPTVRSWLISTACCLLVFWNLLLIRQYYFFLIPHEAGADPWTLLANVQHIVRRF